MEKIIIWSFVSYGMTSIIVWGSIFSNFRAWVEDKSTFFGNLISCMLCTSTWVGFYLSVLTGGITTEMFDLPIKPIFEFFIRVFFDGMFTAGVVWAINSIIEFFEESRIKP